MYNQPFTSLEFGLPTEKVGKVVQDCLTSMRRTGPVQMPAVNRIGRSIECKVTCSPLDGTGDAVVLLMEELNRAERV